MFSNRHPPPPAAQVTSRRLPVPLLAEALCVALLVRVLVRLGGVARVSRWIARMPSTARGGNAADCAAAAARAARIVAHPTCLYRALIGLALLARRHRDVQLHIGARTEPEFGAHAWLVLDGAVVADGEAAAFEPLWTCAPRAAERP